MVKRNAFPLPPVCEFLLVLLIVIFTSVSIRLFEWPLWQDQAFMVDGEYLMATHDAYTWLAGAKMIGVSVDHAFTLLLRFIAGFDFSLASIGFLSPVIFVPFLAIPICIIAFYMRLSEGGIVFGILATSGIGFLVRTRIGFCDTDVVNLIFPIFMVFFLIAWIESFKNDFEQINFKKLFKHKSFVCAFFAGLCGKFAFIFYSGSSSILLPSILLSFLLILLLIRRDFRLFLLAEGLLILGLTFSGWLGQILAVLTACAFILFRHRMSPAIILLLIAGGLGVLFESNLITIIHGLVRNIVIYAKGVVPNVLSGAEELNLPEIAQSIREAQNLDWSLLGPRLGGNWFIFVLGLLGFVFVSWRRPSLLVFLPFLGLGLASVKLGNRFAMYGTVAIGMGLGLGLSELMRLLGQSQGRRWIAQLVLACVVLWPSAVFMQAVRPAPVLPKIYAETFLELREKTEPEALLWQWWDYGYAGQYYAERATFGDGGRQQGQWLYPLARVHCATSPRQASQLIRYFGQAMVNDGLMRAADVRAALFSGNPVSGITQKDVVGAKEFLSKLVLNDRNWATTVTSYFIVSWENLRLASWISYYGNWDIASGTSSPGKIQQVRGEVRMDSATGTLVVGGKSTLIDSMDVVEAEGVRYFQWPHGTGTHVVINQMSRQVFLMDAKMYRSMMVQMLLRPALDFAEDFTLVVDNSPWARAYKVTN